MVMKSLQSNATSEPVRLKIADALLEGEMSTPLQAWGVILFPHGRGTERGVNEAFLTSRFYVAGLATLLVNLLTTQEADLDERTAAFRFDTELLAVRLAKVTDWLAEQLPTKNLPIGYFGVGYTATTALRAAAKRPDLVRAVVTHDAVADFAKKTLPKVSASTLLIGGWNQTHAEQTGDADKQYAVVPGIVALNQPGEVAMRAVEWFRKHLGGENPCKSESSTG